MTPRKDPFLIAGFLFFSLLCRKKTMENRFVFLLLGGILAACSPLDEPPSGGDFRRPRPDITPAVPERPEPPAPKPDTFLYYSAVRFPDDYDWQRDSAYGSVPFELILYRDDAPVLTLAWDPEACFGPDPDRHHLLGGHLYTERMSGGRTRVGRDGTELFHFDGREFLVGLLPDGDDLYTLSRKTSGTGFSYRKNGVLLLESDSGIPFGDLSDPSYGPTGALYRDDGAVVFCYRQGELLYRVTDGQESAIANPVPLNTVLDCKVGDGHNYLLRTEYLTQTLRDGRLWLHPAGNVVTGYFLPSRIRAFSGWMDTLADAAPRQLCRQEAILYYSPEGTYAVAANTAGVVKWFGPGEEGRADFPAYFFSPKCGTVSGGQLVLALTPTDRSLPPRLLRGARQTELFMNGYISAVAVEISPPAS